MHSCRWADSTWRCQPSFGIALWMCRIDYFKQSQYSACCCESKMVPIVVRNVKEEMWFMRYLPGTLLSITEWKKEITILFYCSVWPILCVLFQNLILQINKSFLDPLLLVLKLAGIWIKPSERTMIFQLSSAQLWEIFTEKPNTFQVSLGWVSDAGRDLLLSGNHVKLYFDILLTWNLARLSYFDWSYFEAAKPKMKEKIRGGTKSSNLPQTCFSLQYRLSQILPSLSR